MPSSLYIRSISNLEGKKESASEPDTTIYLGPSRNVYVRTDTGKVLDNIRKLSMNERVADTVEKVDRFNSKDSKKVMDAIMRRQPLFKEFEGEQNMDVDRFKHLVAEILAEHGERRKEVYEDALLRTLRSYDGKEAKNADAIEHIKTAGKQRISGFDENKKPVRPSFWSIPDEANVPEENRKVMTRWFNMIANVADQIVI